MIVSSEHALKLPLHDAVVLGLNITNTRNGFLEVTLNVKLNPEEPVSQLTEMGITGSQLNLVFGNCWQSAVNLMGFAVNQETVSSFELIQESALIRKLRDSGLGSQSMTHFKMEGSSGSTLDFVAETLCVESRNGLSQ